MIAFADCCQSRDQYKGTSGWSCHVEECCQSRGQRKDNFVFTDEHPAFTEGLFDKQLVGLIRFLEGSGLHSGVVSFLTQELQITSVSDFAHYWTLRSYEAAVENEVVSHVDMLKSKQIARLQAARLRAAWKTALLKNAAESVGIGGNARQPKQDLERFFLQCRVDSAVITHVKENLLMETVDDFVHYWTMSETSAAPSANFTIEVARFSYGSTRLMDVTWFLLIEEIEIQQGTFTVAVDDPKRGKVMLSKLMANECRCADGGFVHVYVPVQHSSLYVIKDPFLLPFSVWRSLTMDRVGQDQQRMLNILRRIEDWQEGRKQRVLGSILESELTQSIQDAGIDGTWRMTLTEAEKLYVHLVPALTMNPNFLRMNHPTKHFGISDAGNIGKFLREHVDNQGLIEEPGRLDLPRTAIISCDHKRTTVLADVTLLVSRNVAGTKSKVKKLDALEMEAAASDEMNMMGYQRKFHACDLGSEPWHV